MGIKSIYTDTTGQVQVNPRRVKIISYDNLATVTTAGYINKLAVNTFNVYPTDVIDMIYSYSDATNSGTYSEFIPLFSNGVVTLQQNQPAGIVLPTTANDLAIFTDAKGTLADSAVALSAVQLKANIKANTVVFPGGATSIIISVTGASTSSIPVVQFLSQTNPAVITSIARSGGNIDVHFDTDPGASVLSYIVIIVAQ